MADFAAALINGLATGSVYGLVALGFVLVFKATRIVNLAHGEVMMLGTFLIVGLMDGAGLPYWASVGVALAGMVFIILMLERILLRRMIGESVLANILVTLGLGSMIHSAVSLVFGNTERTLASPFANRTITVAGAVLWQTHVLAIATSVVLLTLFWLFFHRSRTGLGMRAAAEDQAVARLMGVSARRVVALSWGIAAAVATVAGMLAAEFTFVQPDMAHLGLRALPAALLGGMDSVGGAVVGGVILGVTENLAGTYVGGYVKEVSPFVILLVLLIIRPHGLFGSKEIKRV